MIGHRMNGGIRRNAGRKQAVILLLTGVLLTGCGKSSERYYENANEDTAATTESAAEVLYEDAVAEKESYDTGTGQTGAETLDENTKNRKLIKTVNLYVETENYDVLLDNLEKQIETLGGYIEYRYKYNGSTYSTYQDMRYVNLRIRIPEKNLDDFVGKVEEQSNVIDRQEQVEDVTLKYVDLESHKTVLVTEQERLIELLAQAETVEDIIALEQRLSEVRYELESMESQLRTLDNQIDYSTINLDIEEVQRVTMTADDSVFGRIKNGIMDSVYQIGNDAEDGLVWLVVHLPYFLVWIAAAAFVLIIGRLVLKGRKRKKAALRDKEKALALEAEKAEKELREKH